MAMGRERGSKGRRSNRGGKGVGLEVAATPEVIVPVKPTAEDLRVVDEIGDAIDAWVDTFELGRRQVGESVLREVFANDAKAMLRADRRLNVRYDLLVERSEKGLLKEKGLSLLLRVIAYDHLVTGRAWKLLQSPVKEALLPLADKEEPHARETLRVLNAAAKHAATYGFSREAAQAWVRSQQRANGESPRRNATERTFHTQLDRSLDLFGTEDGVDRLLDVAQELEDEDREELAKKMASAAEALLGAVKKLRKG